MEQLACQRVNAHTPHRKTAQNQSNAGKYLHVLPQFIRAALDLRAGILLQYHNHNANMIACGCVTSAASDFRRSSRPSELEDKNTRGCCCCCCCCRLSSFSILAAISLLLCSHRIRHETRSLLISNRTLCVQSHASVISTGPRSDCCCACSSSSSKWLQPISSRHPKKSFWCASLPPFPSQFSAPLYRRTFAIKYETHHLID